jgi:hypothetical protein
MRALRRRLSSLGRRGRGLAHGADLGLARHGVRGFYALVLFYAAFPFDERAALFRPGPGPWAWPAEPLRALGPEGAVAASVGFLMAASLWAARAAREPGRSAAAWWGLMVSVALHSAQPQLQFVYHGMLPFSLLAPAFLLVLLPGGALEERPSRPAAAGLLAVFAACQALLLWTYGLAGLWKLVFGAAQAAAGQASVFSADALGTIAATVAFRDGWAPRAAAAWLIERPEAGRALMLGACGLELLSPLAALAPALHRPIGAALIVFHLGTYWVFGFRWHYGVALLALFLLASPFAPRARAA